MVCLYLLYSTWCEFAVVHIWEFNSSLSFHVDLLYGTVTKHVLFLSIWVQVLNGLIGKYYLLCSITVVLLNLFAE